MCSSTLSSLAWRPNICTVERKTGPCKNVNKHVLGLYQNVNKPFSLRYRLLWPTRVHRDPAPHWKDCGRFLEDGLGAGIKVLVCLFIFLKEHQCNDLGFRLIVTLCTIDQQECRPFWPSMVGEMLTWESNKRGEQIKLTLLEEVDTVARRAIRLSLEVC